MNKYIKVVSLVPDSNVLLSENDVAHPNGNAFIAGMERNKLVDGKSIVDKNGEVVTEPNVIMVGRTKAIETLIKNDKLKVIK